MAEEAVLKYKVDDGDTVQRLERISGAIVDLERKAVASFAALEKSSKSTSASVGSALKFQDVQSGSKAFASAITEMDKALDKISKRIDKIAGGNVKVEFKGLEDATKKLPLSARAFELYVERVADASGKLEVRLQTLRKEIGLVGQSFNNGLPAAYHQHLRATQASVNALTQSMRALERTMHGAGGSSVSGGFRAATKESEAFFSRVSVGIPGVLRAFATLSAVMGGISFVGKGIGAVNDFDESMAKTKAYTEATEADLRKLAAAYREVGATTRYTAAEAAEAGSELAPFLKDAQKIIELLPKVLDFASAVRATPVEAAAIGKELTQGFAGGDISKVPHYFDVMSEAAKRTGKDIQELRYIMAYAAGSAHTFNQSFEQTAAIMTDLINRGLTPQLTGSAINTLYSYLGSTQTGQNVAKLKETNPLMAGRDISFRKNSQEIMPAVDAIDLLRRSGATSREATDILGQEAGAKFAGYFKEGTENVRALSEEYENLGGVAQRTAQLLESSNRGIFRELDSAIEEAFHVFYGDTSLDKVIGEVLKGATEELRAFTGGIDKDKLRNGVLDTFVDIADSMDIFAKQVQSLYTALQPDNLGTAFTQMSKDIIAAFEAISTSEAFRDTVKFAQGFAESVFSWARGTPPAQRESWAKDIADQYSGAGKYSQAFREISKRAPTSNISFAKSFYGTEGKSEFDRYFYETYNKPGANLKPGVNLSEREYLSFVGQMADKQTFAGLDGALRELTEELRKKTADTDYGRSIGMKAEAPGTTSDIPRTFPGLGAGQAMRKIRGNIAAQHAALGTTGSGPLAPFSVDLSSWFPGAEASRRPYSLLTPPRASKHTGLFGPAPYGFEYSEWKPFADNIASARTSQFGNYAAGTASAFIPGQSGGAFGGAIEQMATKLFGINASLMGKTKYDDLDRGEQIKRQIEVMTQLTDAVSMLGRSFATWAVGGGRAAGVGSGVGGLVGSNLGTAIGRQGFAVNGTNLSVAAGSSGALAGGMVGGVVGSIVGAASSRALAILMDEIFDAPKAAMVRIKTEFGEIAAATIQDVFAAKRAYLQQRRSEFDITNSGELTREELDALKAKSFFETSGFSLGKHGTANGYLDEARSKYGALQGTVSSYESFRASGYVGGSDAYREALAANIDEFRLLRDEGEVLREAFKTLGEPIEDAGKKLKELARSAETQILESKISKLKEREQQLIELLGQHTSARNWRLDTEAPWKQSATDIMGRSIGGTFDMRAQQRSEGILDAGTFGAMGKDLLKDLVKTTAPSKEELASIRRIREGKGDDADYRVFGEYNQRVAGAKTEAHRIIEGTAFGEGISKKERDKLVGDIDAMFSTLEDGLVGIAKDREERLVGSLDSLAEGLKKTTDALDNLRFELGVKKGENASGSVTDPAAFIRGYDDSRRQTEFYFPTVKDAVNEQVKIIVEVKDFFKDGTFVRGIEDLVTAAIKRSKPK